MCTVNVVAACVVPAGTVTGPQVSLPAAIAQLPSQPAPCDAIDQDRPGVRRQRVRQRHALRVTATPSLDTVSVKPIGLAGVHLGRIRRLHDLDRRRPHADRRRSTGPSRRWSSSHDRCCRPDHRSPRKHRRSSCRVRGDVHRERRGRPASSPPAPSTGPQVSTPAVIAQVRRSNPHPAASIDQYRPGFVGSVSVRRHALRIAGARVLDGHREADAVTRVHLASHPPSSRSGSPAPPHRSRRSTIHCRRWSSTHARCCRPDHRSDRRHRRSSCPWSR